MKSRPNKQTGGRVVVFGCFDPLHAGHLNFFEQAKALGNSLLVVVARDSSIQQIKKREPHLNESRRLAQVQAATLVDQAILGSEDLVTDRYQLLADIDFDIIALGYDQAPSDETVRRELDKRGKAHVLIVRLKPYQPEVYKSSLYRD